MHGVAAVGAGQTRGGGASAREEGFVFGGLRAGRGDVGGGAAAGSAAGVLGVIVDALRDEDEVGDAEVGGEGDCCGREVGEEGACSEGFRVSACSLGGRNFRCCWGS